MSAIQQRLQFRQASVDDLPAVVALLADDAISAARSGHTTKVTAEHVSALAAIDADPNQEQWVVECDGELIGCLQLSFLPGLSRNGMWRALIEAVRVAAAWRSQGVGAALIAAVEQRARERGCGVLQLTTDKRRAAAHRFYAQHGFVASHEGMKLEL